MGPTQSRAKAGRTYDKVERDKNHRDQKRSNGELRRPITPRGRTEKGGGGGIELFNLGKKGKKKEE